VIGSRTLLALRGAGSRIAWFCAVAFFCWIAAHWLWRAFEPAATPAPIRETADWSAAILSGRAFGFARTETAASPVVPAVPPATARLRLMGIAREAGPREGPASRALLKIDNKRYLWLRAGEELEPGLKLVAIEPDAVRMARDGTETRLLLREPKPALPRGAAVSAPGPQAASPVAAQSATPGALNACKLTPEQRGRAYILRPEIIDGVLRERNGWGDLFKPAGIGLQVTNPGGTGAMLGLYSNDILTKADGAQLGGLDDIARLVLQPLTRNESVVVSGVRAGQPREWIYAGVNCLFR